MILGTERLGFALEAGNPFGIAALNHPNIAAIYGLEGGRQDEGPRHGTAI